MGWGAAGGRLRAGRRGIQPNRRRAVSERLQLPDIAGRNFEREWYSAASDVVGFRTPHGLGSLWRKTRLGRKGIRPRRWRITKGRRGVGMQGLRDISFLLQRTGG